MVADASSVAAETREARNSKSMASFGCELPCPDFADPRFSMNYREIDEIDQDLLDICILVRPLATAFTFIAACHLLSSALKLIADGRTTK